MTLSRRDILRMGLVGCSLAASPLMTPVTFASDLNGSVLGDKRLVVIILRGGMDGLGVVQPLGDPDYLGLRKKVLIGAENGAWDLTGFYAAHRALEPLQPLWAAQDLAFVHATSTPYRDRRSHFDGQDMLEAGTMDVPIGRDRDGWLNRMLQVVPGIQSETSFAIGREKMLLTAGDAPVAEWSPDAKLDMSAQTQRLMELVMHDDVALNEAMGEAIQIAQSLSLEQMSEAQEEGMMAMNMMQSRGGDHRKLAQFAASRLRAETRIASFSLTGWDTHNNQQRGLSRALERLSDTILTLQAGLGADWENTAVIAMTEFGRTARENGTAGTDHGTAGAMVLAGGAINGGKVHGAWPGLSEADLYDRRDLLPTSDVRAHAAWVLRGLYGVDRAALETAVFPGLQMGPDIGLLA
ncbi:DUF1501 domain-containing protein [Nereida sp. MMG025]|uniref:DUF1501 domain-containing protein n=1 Tax=Nereida sp. MMG025 TaxID=2909981 RepID=UPI001F30B878|nr:DUF1501 domain-containing protein [Nereida sp. MMG025]MCF6444059.1 DUF1501 domain-containing protein [Nereida sp. MMG025]